MKRNFFSSGTSVLLITVLVLFVFQNYSFAQDKTSKIDKLMQVYYDLGKFNGTVLVAEKGKVLYKKGFGLANMEWNIPNKPDMKFRIGSITKQFTSMLILQLVEQGKIDLEAKLNDYLPDYRKDNGEKVTIHHLLTHTSGIPSYTGLPEFAEKISRNPYSVDEFVKKYCSGDLEFEPGSKFVYNNSGYFLLGAIIEKVTKKKYEDVLKEKIFDPVGMKNSGYDHHSTVLEERAAGYSKTFDGYNNAEYLDMSLPYAAGSLYSSVEDLYLWDQALYTEKLLSKKMKELLFKPHVSAMGQKYAYGWVVGKRSFQKSKEKVTSIAHGGGINGFNTQIVRLVDDKHLIVLFNNTGGANLAGMSSGIINILYDKQYQLPKKSIAEVIYQTIVEKDVESAIKQYHDLKKEHFKDYDFRPTELNSLGYHLLQRVKKIKEAIEILKLNVKIYPKYANGYDSLAEAYMVNGDKLLAIKNYAKSLELDPNNTNAIEKLNKINKEK